MDHQGYDISNWVVRYPAASIITARPGFRAILYRFRFAFFAVALVAGLYVPTVKSPPVLVPTLQALAVGFIALSLLPAAVALVQRLRIGQEYGRFVIKGPFPWSRRRDYALSDLRSMELLEYDVRTHGRSHWHVRIHTDYETLEFACAVVRRIGAPGYPERVAGFVHALQRITGLVCAPPQYVGFRPGRTMTVSMEPQYHRETYTSLDEMPAELRRTAEEHIARMQSEGTTERAFQRITIQDAEGRVQTYESFDEIPPEIRRRLEDIRRQARRPRE